MLFFSRPFPGTPHPSLCSMKAPVSFFFSTAVPERRCLPLARPAPLFLFFFRRISFFFFRRLGEVLPEAIFYRPSVGWACVPFSESPGGLLQENDAFFFFRYPFVDPVRPLFPHLMGTLLYFFRWAHSQSNFFLRNLVRYLFPNLVPLRDPFSPHMAWAVNTPRQAIFFFLRIFFFPFFRREPPVPSSQGTGRRGPGPLLALAHPPLFFFFLICLSLS